MNEDHPDITWSNQLEDIISAEAERCRGNAWLHQRSEIIQARNNNLIAIPVIVLSTLTGTASIGSESLFNGSQYAGVGIGAVSILVGILQTLSSYFQFSRKAEAHHQAYLQYSKLFSWICVEMGLPRHERQGPEAILTQLRDQMSRLAETTPAPSMEIINLFNKTFKDYDKTIARPLETNGLHRIVIHRPIRPPSITQGESPLMIENPLRQKETTPNPPQGQNGAV